MNSFELLPTEDNLIHTLEKDLLERNKDLKLFYKLLLAQEGLNSIALDGRWGSGKTFFVKQAILLINAENPLNRMDTEKRNSILEALSISEKETEILKNCDMAIYYDAWQNDNDTDSLISLVYTIIQQLGVDYDFTSNIDVFKLAGSILETIKGINVNNIIDILRSENPLEEIEKEKELYKNIKEFFSKILEERGNRLIVFIDELDRCKPSYAVQVLERIKHYLSDNRLTFVFAVNLEELQHTIKHYYGDGFDACRYLDRFFDMRVINTYNMELRELLRFYQQVKIGVYSPTHNSQKRNFSFEEWESLILTYIVPLLIALNIVNIPLYHEFIKGENIEPIMDVYKDSEIGNRLVRILLNENETLNKTEDKNIVTVEDKLRELYYAIFVKKYTYRDYHIIIGNCEFDNKSKNFAIGAAGLLSPYAEY